MSSRSGGGGGGVSEGEGNGGGNGGVRFAGEESKDRLYERKQNKKIVRVLTVMAYVFSVSLAAIMLSLYYVFLWDPRSRPPGHHLHNASSASASAVAAPRVQHQQQAPCSATPPLAPATTTITTGDEAGESQVPATPQLGLPPMKEAEAALAGRRREARSTLMDMTTSTSTTTTQPPPLLTTGRDAPPRRTPTPPPVQGHRGGGTAAKNNKGGGGGEPWHSTPHPAEIAVHA